MSKSEAEISEAVEACQGRPPVHPVRASQKPPSARSDFRLELLRFSARRISRFGWSKKEGLGRFLNISARVLA